jgi:hypothetical protein
MYDRPKSGNPGAEIKLHISDAILVFNVVKEI